MVRRLVQPCTKWLFALVLAVAGLGAVGCAGPPVTPPSPTTQEPQQQVEDPRQAWNPNMVVEPGGRIFLTYYGGLGGSDSRLLFTRSLDGGMTWLPEPVQLDTPPPQRTRIGSHRLEANGSGRVSVTWTIESQPGTTWKVRELRNRQSTDSGATWTETLIWNFDLSGNYPTALTGRNGELSLLWTDLTSPKTVPRFIRTTAGGRAWADTPITLPGTGTATGDKKKGVSADREAHWPALATDPHGNLYAVWQEAVGPGGIDILFNRWESGRHSWLDSSLRLNTRLSEGSYATRIPRVATDEMGGVYVMWEDSRHSTGDLYFNRSLDGGGTWLSQDVWLTAVRPPQADASSPILSADRSGHLYLLWADIRDAPYSLYLNRSLDRGTTWLPTNPIRVDRHAKNAITQAHRLANDDAGHVYTAWWEGTEPTKGSVRFNASSEYGATWLEKPVQLDSGQGKEGLRFPWLRADGHGGVYVIWSSDRSGRYQLHMNRSTDHGQTWLPQDVQITGRLAKVTRGK